MQAELHDQQLMPPPEIPNTDNEPNSGLRAFDFGPRMLPPMKKETANQLQKPRSFLRTSQPGMVHSNLHLSSPTTPVSLQPQTIPTNNNEKIPESQNGQPFVDTAQIEKSLNSLQQQQRIDRELTNQINFQQKHEEDKLAVVLAELDQMEDICNKEKQMIENYRAYLKSTTQISLANKQGTVNEFSLNMKSLFQKKSRALTYVIEGHGVANNFDSPIAIVPNTNNNNKQTKSQYTLTIVQQPSDTAVANRYLIPAPQLSISPPILPTKSTFIVCAALSYHGNVNEEIINTLDGKQEVLQGIKRVTVDTNSHVIFPKLKVMEVSSKHRHQPFCLTFTLEEYTHDGVQITITTVKTAPFHVQSRPNKRKSTDSLPPSKRVFSGPIPPQLFARKVVTSSLPNLPTIRSEKEQAALTSSSGGLDVTDNGTVGMEDGTNSDYNYIDITDLLILPQKEAARRLGISESMLCKRFKECTRRKWPYRYLRKIDKVIGMLQLHQQEGSEVQGEFKDKLEKLTQEREECLKPVKIRITTYDKILSAHNLPKFGGECDDDEEESVLESLETLKNSKDTLPTIVNQSSNAMEMSIPQPVSLSPPQLLRIPPPTIPIRTHPTAVTSNLAPPTLNGSTEHTQTTTIDTSPLPPNIPIQDATVKREEMEIDTPAS